MGMPIGFGIVNSQMINPVYSNFTAGVNYIIVFHYDTHMNNVAFIIIKKG
jgi:hypothetical protein